MSETMRITEMVQINTAGDVLNGPDWMRQCISHAWRGFVFNGEGYDYGNWICRVSTGAIAIYTNEFVQMIAASVPAMVKAGLVADADAGDDSFTKRFITAFKDGTPMIYVKPDIDEGGDGTDIVVLERAAYRDELTSGINTSRTWIIIASEYVSGQLVEGVRLSFFIEQLQDANIDYTLSGRGPELK